jgi:hypothetical protein
MKLLALVRIRTETWLPFTIWSIKFCSITWGSVKSSVLWYFSWIGGKKKRNNMKRLLGMAITILWIGRRYIRPRWDCLLESPILGWRLPGRQCTAGSSTTDHFYSNMSSCRTRIKLSFSVRCSKTSVSYSKTRWADAKHKKREDCGTRHSWWRWEYFAQSIFFDRAAL